MKCLALIFSAGFVFVLLFFTGTTFSSCTKQVTRDTVIVRDTTIIRDTTIKRDTTVIIDTVTGCNASGLVAYYNFTGGNLNDSSGHNNTITFNSATKTSDRFGRPNNAYLFDGSTSYMDIPNSASLNPQNITMMAIVKINGYDAGSCHANQILGKGYPDDVDGFYGMRFADINSCDPTVDSAHEYFQGYHGDNIPQGTAAGAIPDSIVTKKGTWYILVYTYDGQTSNYYINGVLKDSEQKTSVFTANTFDLLIGKHGDPNFPYWFNGVIDEIRIYNKALSATAVQQFNSLTN